MDPEADYGEKVDRDEGPEELKDPLCSCGDNQSHHVDACEQCFICKCKEYNPFQDNV